jgi:hypothetical protein
MEIQKTQVAAQQQVLQRPKEVEGQEIQPQVAAKAEKSKKDEQSQQVQQTPPPPDENKGQTFSKYA